MLISIALELFIEPSEGFWQSGVYSVDNHPWNNYNERRLLIGSPNQTFILIIRMGLVSINQDLYPLTPNCFYFWTQHAAMLM